MGNPEDQFSHNEALTQLVACRSMCLGVCGFDSQSRLILYSENQGADRLRDYHAADLRHCFHLCKKQVFLWLGTNEGVTYIYMNG